MSKTFALRCEACGALLTSTKYPLVCSFCNAENWAADSFSFSEQRAVSNLRLIHGAECTFSATIGMGSYGSAEDLFRSCLIPMELAEAFNVSVIVNGIGLECKGTNKPLSGYRFQLKTVEQTYSRPPSFEAWALVDIDTHKMGIWNFFIDETAVIRFSQAPGLLPGKTSEVLNAEIEQRVWR